MHKDSWSKSEGGDSKLFLCGEIIVEINEMIIEIVESKSEGGDSMLFL